MAEKEKPATDVATEQQNAKLEHTQGGPTARADATDLGAPMPADDGTGPGGPQDVAGPGPKRGDYSGRLGTATTPHEVVRIPDAKPGEPVARGVDQAPRASDTGEVKGKKGGVETAE